MKDEACICFLQWALPRLHLRWAGFRRVRGQVCKRLDRRLGELALPNLQSYRLYLENRPLEWHVLDSICRITISRFFRDHGLFIAIRQQVLPELIDNMRVKGESSLSCWCIGAASGEEPYSLRLLWDLTGLRQQGVSLSIFATEADQHMLSRAGAACYPESSLAEVPDRILKKAFTAEAGLFCLKELYRKRVQFLRQDIRKEQPDASFDLIFCRNLVFTYFAEPLQEETGLAITRRLKPGGFLVIGAHEHLPPMLEGLKPWLSNRMIYRREG